MQRENDRFAHGQFQDMEVYAAMGEGYARMAIMMFATVVPTLGVETQRDSSTPGLTISWPASVPFGPMIACSVNAYHGGVATHRLLRLVVEPGILVRSPKSLFLRPGVRAIWHRSSWRVGLGAGVGSTLAWIDGKRGAASFSPEVLVHFGECCSPGYFLLSIRADRYYAGHEPDAAVASLSFTYW